MVVHIVVNMVVRLIYSPFIRNVNLLPNHTLRFTALDSGEPNTATAINKMTEMKYEMDVSAFIGPEHNCVSEALVAAAWNMPMITYVSIIERAW